MKQLRLLLSFMFLVAAFVASAQNITVTGTVIDSENNETFAYAAVVVKESNKSALTDADGNYSIITPHDGILVFSFAGYKTTEVAINNRSKIDVTLESESVNIDEVMVVAYGTARKESFTGSAEVIKGDVIAKRPVSNVTKALDGATTGLISLGGSGQPGSGTDVVIRGFGSLNASNNPLYVVDGVPFDSDISAISSSDIASITVIKDASAGALYGARGANGVIMITTKRGEEGTLKVNLKMNFGFASRAISRYETLNSKEWIEDLFVSSRYEGYNAGYTGVDAGNYAIDFMANGIYGIFGVNEQYNPYNMALADLIDPATGKVNSNAKLLWDEDWLDEGTSNAAFRQEYVLSASGGTNKSHYMFSFGYLDQNGIVTNTNFRRYTGRTNVDTQITDWLSAGINLSASSSVSNATALGSDPDEGTAYYSSIFYTGAMIGPIYPVYEKDSDGNTIYNTDGSKAYDWGDNRPIGACTGWSSIATLEEDKNENGNDNLSGRAFVNLLDLKEGAIKGLKFSTNLGFDYISSNLSTYYNPNFGDAVSLNGYLENHNTRTFSYTFNQLITYNRKIGKHNIDLLAGHEFFQRNYQYLGGAKSNVVFDGLYELDSFTTISDLSGYSEEYVVDSYLARFNYDYNDRYYFSASYRRDASSRFHPDNRWGNFWSVGGSWRVSEESFMQDFDWLNNLTAKVSYGVQGNDNIGSYYAWQQLYSMGYNNTSYGGVLVSSLENQDLRWEKNGNLNIGIEAKMFRNRLSISAEYYNKITKDMLMEYPVALSVGFSSYDANVGKMRNSGFEMTVSGDVIRGSKLTWNTGIMLSTVTNKILALTGSGDSIQNGSYINQVGESLNSFYLAKSAGVDPETGDQLYYTWTEDSNGKKTYETTNSYGVASAYREISGSRIPTIYGSWNNTLRFGNFDFSLVTTYSLGGQIVDNIYSSYLYNAYAGTAGHVDRKNAWQEVGDITDIPRIDLGGRYYRVYTGNDLVSASYLSIESVNIGYTLPEKLTKLVGISSFRVFASGDNLFMLAARKGLNPQFNFTGTTGYSYVPERVISIGLDLAF